MAFKIGIDAGHGINTPGKRTPDGEREWSFNDKVADAFIAEISKYEGSEVKRVDDPTGKTDVPLSTRTNGVNAWKADIHVSIHFNANTGKWGTWTGVETYIYPNSASGMKLAQAIHPSMVKAMGLRDRGIKSANFHMVRETKMPAILLELGYMDSSIDIKKLRDDNVLKNAGIELAKAVAAYAGLKKKPEPKPAPKPVAKKGLYKVQVGAFSQRGNADRLLKELEAKGFKGFIKFEEV